MTRRDAGTGRDRQEIGGPGAPGAGATAPRQKAPADLAAASATAAVFLALGAVRMLAHEPWRDELEGWALARDAARWTS